MILSIKYFGLLAEVTGCSEEKIKFSGYYLEHNYELIVTIENINSQENKNNVILTTISKKLVDIENRGRDIHS